MLLSCSIKGSDELKTLLMPVYAGSEEYANFSLLANYPTLMHYIKLLIFTPKFYTVFFNSIKMDGTILILQMLIAVPGAWAFSRFCFPGKNLIFAIYVILMLMPFQVTMLSQYLLLNGLKMLNTHAAIILPAAFSTMSVFLIYRGFASIPEELLDAARVDGAGEFSIFLRIGIPLGSTGILSAAILSFLECYNMIEQPLAFLKDQVLWPLSLYLPEIGGHFAGEGFAASVITLIPAILVFILGQDYLEKGIISSAMKG